MSGSSSSQQPAVTTQTSSPWSGAQPFLSQMYGQAANLWGSGTGYAPYAGPTQADLNPLYVQGFNQAQSLAGSEPYGSPALSAARNFATTALNNGGLNPNDPAVINQMQGQIGQYGDIYNRAGNVYTDASGQTNPYLQAEIDAQNRIVADKVNSAMSGAGRYGSGAHTDVLSRSLAEVADPILAQDYAQRQQTRLAALGMQGNATQGGVAGLGQIANIYNQGQQLAGQWAQLVPALDQAQFMPSQELMAQGQTLQDRAQQDLAAQIQLYNAQQAYPWESLSRYAGILSGAGALGGSKVTTATPGQTSLTQRLLGGAIAGGGLGSIFGAPGAAIGALGGGLLGSFG